MDWPNPLMKDLQNACRLSNFSVDYLLTEAKNMTAREYERSMDRKEARAEGLEMDAKLRKFVVPSNGLSSGF